jgi:hypothetical protein
MCPPLAINTTAASNSPHSAKRTRAYRSSVYGSRLPAFARPRLIM